MKTLILALRNLMRNRRRSLVTMLAMIVGANAVLLFGGYCRNLVYGLETDYVKFGGHLQVQRAGYHVYGSGDPAAYSLAGYREIIEASKADPVLAPMLVVATPTLQVQGIAGNFGAGVSRTALAQGVVVEDQNLMRTWNDYGFPVATPPLALTGTSDDSAVVGTGLARTLQLCGMVEVHDCRPQPRLTRVSADLAADVPDDVAQLASMSRETVADPARPRTVIELLAATAYGAPNVAQMRIVKAEPQAIKEYDDVYVGVHLAQAQRLVYGGEAPKVTAIVYQFRKTAQLASAKARLEHLLQSRFPEEAFEVVDFGTLNPFYGQALAMFASMFVFVALLIGAIVLFTVSNTMSMAVIERTVEVGTLRAIGLRRRGILRMFMCEGLLLGVAGAVLGVLAATAVASVINASGITWTPPGRSPVPLIIRVWGQNELIAGTVLGLALVAVLSAWLPARRASRMNVVDALRHV